MRILIADDEKGIRSLYKTILQSHLPHVQVDAVANGAEAVDAFKNTIFDIVLMDIFMAPKDGYQASIEIRDMCRMENLKIPYIIFCTSFSLSKEVQKLLEEKNYYSLLKKPATIDQIVDSIKAVQL